MSRKQVDRARREAPELVSLLEELETQKASITHVRAAWDEIFRLTDEYVSAGEAADILGVLGANVYSELRSAKAIELFGPTTRPDGIGSIVGVTLRRWRRHASRSAERSA
jgi:hypothetical protein